MASGLRRSDRSWRDKARRACWRSPWAAFHGLNTSQVEHVPVPGDPDIGEAGLRCGRWATVPASTSTGWRWPTVTDVGRVSCTVTLPTARHQGIISVGDPTTPGQRPDP